MNILVTGAAGAMGRTLRDTLDARYLSREELDVRDPARIAVVFRHYRPDVVLHTAAVTAADAPSADLIAINIAGTRHIARWCRAFGVRLVYLSTQYVYGSEAPVGGWTELDTPAPIGAYAWSKLAGEHWVETVPEHTIVRGSWYTPAKVRAWAERGALVDAWHNREPVASAARKIAALAEAGPRGIINIGARTRETFHDTARRELPGEPVADTLREDINLGSEPYAFPRDTTVCTARWDAWARQPVSL